MGWNDLYNYGGGNIGLWRIIKREKELKALKHKQRLKAKKKQKNINKYSEKVFK